MRNTGPDFEMTLGEIAEVCGGEVGEDWASAVATGVSTDTREVQPGELFVALTGARHNGHDFVGEAFERGAVGAVVARGKRGVVVGRQPLVTVDDTLVALGKIASRHRSKFNVAITAVSGSTGKTTTKNMLGGILAQSGPTLAAPGTYNNEIGVPKALLSLSAEHRFCVLEFAMRGPGEIAYLAKLAEPQVGVITNVGQSHVGRLGSREAIAQVKAELLQHLPADGAAVLNAGGFFFQVFAEMAPCDVISFGLGADADVRAVNVGPAGLDGMDFVLAAADREVPVHLQVLGQHNVMNALAAAAAALALEVSPESIATGLSEYAGAPMRLEPVQGPRGSMIINDAYNASPDSVEAALAVLAACAGRKILVFGDMLELGAAAEEAHRVCGEQAARAGVAWLVAVSEMAAAAAEEAAKHGVRADLVADAQQAVELLRPEIGEGDLILVKGSRALELERVAEGLSDG